LNKNSVYLYGRGPEINDEYAVDDNLQFTTQLLYTELGIIVLAKEAEIAARCGI
jgi:hypothetical protein